MKNRKATLHVSLNYFVNLLLYIFVLIFISNAVASEYLNLLDIEPISILLEEDSENKEEKEQNEETERFEQEEFITESLDFKYSSMSNTSTDSHSLHLERPYQEILTPPPKLV